MKLIIILTLMASAAWAQTKTYGSEALPDAKINNAAATSTRPVKEAASAPSTCAKGEQYFNTTSASKFTCTATDTWTEDVPAKYKTRVCEIHIWGSGASQVLQDADDEPASCYNGSGVTETVTAVACWANSGSPTVTPIVTGGSGLLTGALTCGTASFAAGTLSGTPTIPSGGTIDANVTTAGGTATNIRLVVTLTR